MLNYSGHTGPENFTPKLCPEMLNPQCLTKREVENIQEKNN